MIGMIRRLTSWSWTALLNMMNLVMARGIPDEILPIFYGCSFCALTKPNGGVGPIAAGNKLIRLASKVDSEPLVDTLGDEFRPLQRSGLATHRGNALCKELSSRAHSEHFSVVTLFLYIRLTKFKCDVCNVC